MNVLVVDDDFLVGTSLKMILEAEPDIHVPAVGRSGMEAVSLYSSFLPDILLMDIRMENMNGLEAAEQILVKYPDAKILFLTTFSDDEYIVKALKLGAKGYLLKQSFDSIAPALHAVYGGQIVYGYEVGRKLPEFLSQKKEAEEEVSAVLSKKEFDIVKLVAEGQNNKEIAQNLFLSEGTVRNYLSTILLKLDLRDRTQLAVYYYKHLQE